MNNVDELIRVVSVFICVAWPDFFSGDIDNDGKLDLIFSLEHDSGQDGYLQKL
jgi:hypothetical protein